ncbi:TIGR03086 family metal-binding protein [Streptomyces sp. PU-14G]|uniref:TIGR03086 family metal-binding protein n=1 Tax=Streptomyces sp. PU-14G TaxID=2800808 RepID=UPI0034E00E8D
MTNGFDGLVDRFRTASAGFTRTLRAVRRPEQWCRPTPCTEWNVRQLANHMARGNLNYVTLLEGGSAEDFLRCRDVDALGDAPVDAYVRSVEACAEAFGRPGALDRTLDYPLGRVGGRQALAVRITDSTVHTWDLARALGTDDTLDPALVGWIADHLEAIYAGLAETPTDPATTHRFFAAPGGGPLSGEASAQARLLHRLGRTAG